MVARTYQRLSAESQALRARLDALEVCPTRGMLAVLTHYIVPSYGGCHCTLFVQGLLDEGPPEHEDDDDDGGAGTQHGDAQWPPSGASVHEDGSVTFRFAG